MPSTPARTPDEEQLLEFLEELKIHMECLRNTLRGQFACANAILNDLWRRVEGLEQQQTAKSPKRKRQRPQKKRPERAVTLPGPENDLQCFPSLLFPSARQHGIAFN